MELECNEENRSMNISIITPCFNSDQWIRQCIASVRHQLGEVCLHEPRVSAEALNVKNVETPGGSLNEPPTLEYLTMQTPQPTPACGHPSEGGELLKSPPLEGCRNGGVGFSTYCETTSQSLSALMCNDLNTTVPVAVHHHIQDGGSSDGTVGVLQQLGTEIFGQGSESNGSASDNGCPITDNYRLSWSSAPDDGMYNALNKAFAAVAPNNPSQITNDSHESVVGHLNADEQYLPGTLQFVADYFKQHPEVDVLFGAVVVTDADGSYICSRMPLKPQLLHTQVCHLSTFTAAMFFRRSAIEKLDCYFDESFKTAGDADLICRMLKAKLRMATVRRYFSIFVDSGDNLALSGQARAERERMAAGAPLWARKAAFVIEKVHRARKFFSGSYRLRRFQYQFISGRDSAAKRVTVTKPVGRWETRLGNS
jgi:hypothetical protein